MIKQLIVILVLGLSIKISCAQSNLQITAIGSSLKSYQSNDKVYVPIENWSNKSYRLNFECSNCVDVELLNLGGIIPGPVQVLQNGYVTEFTVETNENFEVIYIKTAAATRQFYIMAYPQTDFIYEIQPNREFAFGDKIRLSLPDLVKNLPVSKNSKVSSDNSVGGVSAEFSVLDNIPYINLNVNRAFYSENLEFKLPFYPNNTLRTLSDNFEGIIVKIKDLRVSPPAPEVLVIEHDYPQLYYFESDLSLNKNIPVRLTNNFGQTEITLTSSIDASQIARISNISLGVDNKYHGQLEILKACNKCLTSANIGQHVKASIDILTEPKLEMQQVSINAKKELTASIGEQLNFVFSGSNLDDSFLENDYNPGQTIQVTKNGNLTYSTQTNIPCYLNNNDEITFNVQKIIYGKTFTLLTFNVKVKTNSFYLKPSQLILFDKKWNHLYSQLIIDKSEPQYDNFDIKFKPSAVNLKTCQEGDNTLRIPQKLRYSYQIKSLNGDVISVSDPETFTVFPDDISNDSMSIYIKKENFNRLVSIPWTKLEGKFSHENDISLTPLEISILYTPKHIMYFLKPTLSSGLNYIYARESSTDEIGKNERTWVWSTFVTGGFDVAGIEWFQKGKFATYSKIKSASLGIGAIFSPSSEASEDPWDISIHLNLIPNLGALNRKFVLASKQLNSDQKNINYSWAETDFNIKIGYLVNLEAPYLSINLASRFNLLNSGKYKELKTLYNKKQ